MGFAAKSAMQACLQPPWAFGSPIPALGWKPEVDTWAADLALPLTSCSVNLSELPRKESNRKSKAAYVIRKLEN